MRIYLDDITKTLSDSDILIRDHNDALNVSESKMNEEKRRVCELIEKFESYVNSVPKYTKPHVHESTLFYGFIIVGRIANIIQKKFQFPETVSECFIALSMPFTSSFRLGESPGEYRSALLSRERRDEFGQHEQLLLSVADEWGGRTIVRLLSPCDSGGLHQVSAADLLHSEQVQSAALLPADFTRVRAPTWHSGRRQEQVDRQVL